jgi:hypothetical protein
MGTRGLTKVIYKGETIVAQYGQWDHYPEGQGVTLYHTLKDSANVENFIKKIPQIYYPSDDEIQALAKPFEDGSMEGMMTFDSGKMFAEKFPTLTRDTGAEIFRTIANWDESPIPIFRDVDFEKDELFCEGVYIVDLDKELFTTKFGRDEGSWDILLVLHFDSIREMNSHEDYIESCKEATLVK